MSLSLSKWCARLLCMWDGERKEGSFTFYLEHSSSFSNVLLRAQLISPAGCAYRRIVCVHTYVCINTYCVCAYLCGHIHEYMCISIYLCVTTYVCIHVYMCIHVCMCIVIFK